MKACISGISTDSHARVPVHADSSSKATGSCILPFFDLF